MQWCTDNLKTYTGSFLHAISFLSTLLFTQPAINKANNIHCDTIALVCLFVDRSVCHVSLLICICCTRRIWWDDIHGNECVIVVAMGGVVVGSLVGWLFGWVVCWLVDWQTMCSVEIASCKSLNTRRTELPADHRGRHFALNFVTIYCCFLLYSRYEQWIHLVVLWKYCGYVRKNLEMGNQKRRKK